jgi:DNA-binding transcriptional LysR family regulator
MYVELQQLKYFQTVARLEHMTRAAEELHISQPSLSITIARLEEDLGVPLFDRHRRQIQLNSFGKLFLQHVNRIFAEIEAGKREAKELAGLEGGLVTLASANLTLLPHLLSRFLASHPSTQFRLVQSSTAEMQRQLEQGDVDFCISSPLLQGKDIESTMLLEEDIVLIVPAGHRLAGQASICLSEAKDEPFISLKIGYGLRDYTDHLCRLEGFVPKTACEVDEPLLVNTLVKSGVGVAFLPYSAWRGLANSAVVAVRIDKPLCRRAIGLAWSNGRYKSAAADRFQQFVVEYFRNLQLGGHFEI